MINANTLGALRRGYSSGCMEDLPSFLTSPPPKTAPAPCSLLFCRAAGWHPMWRRDRGAACDLVALANSCLVHICALIPCLWWITLSKPFRKGSIKQGEGHRDWLLLWDRNSVALSSAQFPSLLCLLSMAWGVPCLSPGDT